MRALGESTGDAGEVNSGQGPFLPGETPGPPASCPLVGWASWSKASRREGCELGWEYQSTRPTNPGGDPIPAVSCLSGPGSPVPGGRSSRRLTCWGHTGLPPIRVLNRQHQNSLLGVVSPGSSAPVRLANCCAQRRGASTRT